MQIEKVNDNLYIITGSGAGDTSAFSGGNVVEQPATLAKAAATVNYVVTINPDFAGALGNLKIAYQELQKK
jgi:hypothetical protein